MSEIEVMREHDEAFSASMSHDERIRSVERPNAAPVDGLDPVTH